MSGNRFILTVIDFTSHFPLVYPLITHTAAEVVRCLIHVFSTFGSPDEMLSDCGSEFMSELSCFYVSVRRVAENITVSPAGCLERFHRTLKSILEGVGETFPGIGTRCYTCLPIVKVEGLEFFPFDLVFGRNVKGVLQLIK